MASKPEALTEQELEDDEATDLHSILQVSPSRALAIAL